MCFVLFVHSGDDEFDDFPDTESPGEIILIGHCSFRFWFLIWVSQSRCGFKNNSPNLHKRTTNWRILMSLCKCYCPIFCLLLSYPGCTSEIIQDCEVIAYPQNLYFLFRDRWVCIWKLKLDLLTSIARGWAWGKEKIGMLQPPSCTPCTLLPACFAQRLIDLKKNLCTGNIVLHVFVNS